MVKIQQGDCILFGVSGVPVTAKKVKTRVVEKGEGVHTHVVEGECDVYMDGDVMYLKTNGKAKLVHEEHGVQDLEPNIVYKKVIEREFDYESMEARNVID
jgi:hypothetical protein